MQVSSAATLLLCYFANINHDPVPNYSDELCILSHTGAIAQEKSSLYVL